MEDTAILRPHIRIGEEFQAFVPFRAAVSSPDDLAETDDRMGELVWDCDRGEACGAEQFIERLQQQQRRQQTPAEDAEEEEEEEEEYLGGISVERALALLVECEYDTERAEQLALTNPALRVLDGAADKWDAGECRLFEYAYMRFGSDFFAIAEFMHPRTVAEVQQHYYTWKNGSAYQSFLARCDAELREPSDDSTTSGGDSSEDEGIRDATAAFVAAPTPAPVATAAAASVQQGVFSNDAQILPNQGAVAVVSNVQENGSDDASDDDDDEDGAAAVALSALASPQPSPRKRPRTADDALSSPPLLPLPAAQHSWF